MKIHNRKLIVNLVHLAKNNIIKLLWFSPVLLCWACNSGNSDIVNFKVEYKPGCVYNQTMTDKSEMMTKYDASPEIMQALKDKGVQNPTKTANNVSILIKLKSGKMGPQNIYPFTVEYVKTTSQDGKKEIPDNTLFYGTDTLGKIPVLDSVSSPQELDAKAKKSLLQNIEQLLQESCGPEKTVKMGESFTKVAPMNVDLGITKLQMDVTTTYKLKSMANGLATFDISQIYALNSTVKDHTFKADGTGTGSIVYDVAGNYYKDYSTNMVLNMSMDNGGIFANIHTESNMDIQTTLVQN